MILKTGDFELSWTAFLHEFYRYRTASFLEHPPPRFLSLGWRAILAGTAEWLSKEFGLFAPEWTELPDFFLPEVWDVLGDFLTEEDVVSLRAERIARCEHEFLRRNVIFETRSLIVI